MELGHLPLVNKVALVTGGGAGIGKAICLTFASAGADVVVVDIETGRAEETAREVRQSGRRALARTADVTDPAQVRSMAEAAFREFGHVDILVNNVGTAQVPSVAESSFRLVVGAARIPFLQSTEEMWDALYHINLRHIFLCCKAIVPQMVERGQGGAVINLSSVEAFRAAPDLAVYTAFKGAITQFTKSFAMEVAQHRVRVNAIAPDLIQTPQVDYASRIPPEQRHLWPFWVPLGRVGQPDDVAGVALFLASDLSQFMTGTTVHVDGGTYAAGGWFRRQEGGWTNRPVKA